MVLKHSRETTVAVTADTVNETRFRQSFDEQRRIVARVDEQLSATDALRAAIEQACRRSASLRRAVLERAFRGELVSQDPSDEPASVLLERIASERAATTVRPAKRVRPGH